jgi:hypothetical protein
MRFLKVKEKPTNALIIQWIGTQYSPSRFGILKCHNQGVKHDAAAETGAQFRGKQRGMKAEYCNRRRDGRDIPTITTFNDLCNCWFFIHITSYIC